MALAVHPVDQELTYDDYMLEDEIYRRYDIIDGKRVFMTNPTILHQEIAGTIYEQLRIYQRKVKSGRTIQARCDVLITKKPFRTRQPDVSFITNERLGNRKLTDPSPLTPAPELVVEVISPSETRSTRLSKIADYQKVNVQECWLVSPEAETIEVIQLTEIATRTIDIYGHDDILKSAILPDLAIPVADIFAVES
jgi:Uma2 family endonuclease